MLIIGLSLFPKSQLHSIFSIYNGHFFNIYGAYRAIDVDTRREVVIKTWKTSAKNRSFSISNEPNKRHYFNIYGACKAIDVDTRHEVVLKTWKTSDNNRSFSISPEPTAQTTALYFLKCQMDIFSILMVHAKLLMLIQHVEL